MKTSHLICSLAAAGAMVALSCGTASAQTPTNADTVHSSAASGGAAADRTASPGGAMAQGEVSRDATQAFVTQAAQANRAEVEEAKYIMDHTKSQAVKDFAQRMISDHTTALDQLKQIASTDGYRVPNGVDPKDKESMDSLKHDKGGRMNMAYSSDQEKDHRETISKFEQAAQNRAIAPVVRDYARTTLPVLKEHLRMAQQLVASESKGNHKAG
jgi:putative membrane protein